MVMIKNPTYIGKGPGIPTTPVPSYKASPADPYYPKGSMGMADPEPPAPPPAPAPTPAPTPTPTPKPVPEE